MVLIEFLKNHKTALLIGLCVSTFLLSTTLIVLANLDLWVLMGLMMLLTPPGFSFVLFGILLLGSIICALLWTGLNYGVHYIREWCARREASLLIKEDKQTTWVDKRLTLSGDPTSDQTMVLMDENDNSPNTFLSREDELAEFSKKANNLLTRLNTAISSQEDVTALSVCFDTFKKAYYRLAKKYHPDKGMPDKVIWSTQQFQTLNAIYSNVKMKVDYKLKSVSQKSKDALLDEENQVLKVLIDLLKEHLKWLKQAEQELESLKVLMDNLDKGIARNVEGVRLIDEGLAQNAQRLTEHAELLKKQDEFVDYAEATFVQLNKEQAILMGIAEKAFQKDKSPTPPNVDDEKNRDEKNPLPFFSPNSTSHPLNKNI